MEANKYEAMWDFAILVESLFLRCRLFAATVRPGNTRCFECICVAINVLTHRGPANHELWLDKSQTSRHNLPASPNQRPRLVRVEFNDAVAGVEHSAGDR
jgi:hypothetical protein